MAWWFHPDRRHDFQQRAQVRDATDFTVVLSTENSVRVRTASWRDRRGGHHQHRTETQVGPEGAPLRHGDRFIAPFKERAEGRSQTGRLLTLECTGQLEFIPTDSGSTEIVSTHNHYFTGGNWLHRQRAWKVDLESQPRDYRVLAVKCDADLRS
jgi:hypothetical protein